MVETAIITTLTSVFKEIKSRFSKKKILKEKQKELLFDFIDESYNNMKILSTFIKINENPCGHVKLLKDKYHKKILKESDLKHFDFKILTGLKVGPDVMVLHPKFKKYKQYYLINIVDLINLKLTELKSLSNTLDGDYTKWRPRTRLRNLLMRYVLMFMHIGSNYELIQNNRDLKKIINDFLNPSDK